MENVLRTEIYLLAAGHGNGIWDSCGTTLATDRPGAQIQFES